MSKDPKEKKGSRQTSFLFPIITFGKYVEEEGRRKLSAALTISHASADGYHASMFFERLQEVLDEFVIDQ